MLRLTQRALLGATFLAVGALPALAADPYEPPVVDVPEPEIVHKEVSYGGWYLRGDVGYGMSKFRGAEYIRYGSPEEPGEFDFGELRNGFSVGGGIGYQASRHLRTDLTVDHWFKRDFNGQTTGENAAGATVVSTDTSSFSATLLLANAYAELGTYKRITPYVGAGIGGAYVKWNDLRNQIPDEGIDDLHRGASGMRFAWAVMAGASYCVSKNVKADLGYRYSRIAGGRMFEEFAPDGSSIGVGPGFDKGIGTHEVRAGLRYQFGGGEDCVQKDYVAYEPPKADYKPIFK